MTVGRIRFSKTDGRGRSLSPAMGQVVRRAFTLMEVLIVVALLGLVASVAMMDFGTLIDGARTPSAYETLSTALVRGRTRALDGGAPVKLVYDRNAAALRLVSSGAPEDFPIANLTGVTFQLPAEDSTDSERPLDAVVFHPSGYTTPALVDLSVRGEHAFYRIEPFSAAPAEVKP